jgi:uncharacterized protein YcfL
MFKKISFGLVFFVIFASCFLSACSKNIDLSYRTKQYLHLNETLLYHTTSVTAFNEVLSIANDSNEENYYQVANSKKHTIVIKYVNAVSEKTLIK